MPTDHPGHRRVVIACLASIVAAVLLAFGLPAPDVYAERRPVLPQIAVPHDYYYREMYLPQLTSGPGSLAWMPDGDALVYSMMGSLWYQRLDGDAARQLTDGPGYDYQPDVAPDGRRVAFTRYTGDALELQLLDLETGAVTPLTHAGDVNVEPRFSADGNRLAFVSTGGTGRFHVFVGDLTPEGLVAAPLVEERESPVERYYYGSYDHELSPAWTPDGETLVVVSNRDVPYGTGNLWQIGVTGEAERLVRREETTWKARPDVAPDGRRVVYSSYLGRQWHQLWVARLDGLAEPFPLGYGDYDATAARWSPDGRRIAYISNEAGNTAIRIQDFIGGRRVTLEASHLDYLAPRYDYDLRIVDGSGRPAAARVAVTDTTGRAYAPRDAWTHADDGFDRNHGRYEAQYFHSDGQAQLALPGGAAKITIWRGPEHRIVQLLVNVMDGRDNGLTVPVRPLPMPESWHNWASADVHVHMNYGGTYRNTPPDLVAQARAEDLDLVFNLVVNKEQRIPDIRYFSPEPDASSADGVTLLHAQEYHTSFWGHLGLLGLTEHLLIPDYAAYPYTAAASLYPDNATVAGLARAQGAAVGYVHPFADPPPDPAADAALTNALPVDAALGLVDYYEVVGFADHRASAEVWYRLLNCGARIAAAGGTDAMANYASLRGPVGINRTYVRVNGEATTPAARRDAWLAGLKSGRTMATNGPLVALTVEGRHPGDTIRIDNADGGLEYEGWLRSAVPVDHLELVMNGRVVKTLELDATRTAADFSGSVEVTDSGWLLVRAWNEGADPHVFDIYPYATTSPVYLDVGGRPPRSETDGEYFETWLDRIREAVAAHGDFNDNNERGAILANIDRAGAFYAACR